MPNTHLPRQVQRQIEEAEALDKEIAEASAAPVVVEEPEVPVVPEAPVLETVPPSPPTPPEAQWEQKYRTIDGKYKAEVPRLHAQVRELQSQLAQVTANLETLTKRPAAPAPTAKTSLVTDKDVELFGSDLVDLIKRQSEDVVSGREAALVAKIESLQTENVNLKAQVSGVTKTQEQSAQDVYLGKLTALVPDWETINADEGFLTWLGEVDSMSGLTRQAYIDNAFNAHDAARTAVIFNAWKAVAAPAVPTPAVPQPRPDVQRQVAPGKSKSVPLTASDADKKIWTTAEIETFYRDASAGAYRDNPTEQAKIEAEIDLAVATGRIRA